MKRPGCLQRGEDSRGDHRLFHGLLPLANYISWRIAPVLIGARQKTPKQVEESKITPSHFQSAFFFFLIITKSQADFLNRVKERM